MLHQAPRPASFCANRVWSGVFKPRMMQLVGRICRRMIPALSISKAYDTAYQVLYATLPDCRNCGCDVLEEIL